jgi:hypothetical protein
VKPNASNRRLRAAWYAFDSRIRSRRRSPSPSTAFAMLRAASSMIAHALSSAGEVRNGSSRMKEGVRWRGIGQEITGGVYGLQALSVESAFGACALIPRPKGYGIHSFCDANAIA